MHKKLIIIISILVTIIIGIGIYLLISVDEKKPDDDPIINNNEPENNQEIIIENKELASEEDNELLITTFSKLKTLLGYSISYNDNVIYVKNSDSKVINASSLCLYSDSIDGYVLNEETIINKIDTILNKEYELYKANDKLIITYLNEDYIITFDEENITSINYNKTNYLLTLINSQQEEDLVLEKINNCIVEVKRFLSKKEFDNFDLYVNGNKNVIKSEYYYTLETYVGDTFPVINIILYYNDIKLVPIQKEIVENSFFENMNSFEVLNSNYKITNKDFEKIKSLDGKEYLVIELEGIEKPNVVMVLNDQGNTLATIPVSTPFSSLVSKSLSCDFVTYDSNCNETKLYQLFDNYLTYYILKDENTLNEIKLTIDNDKVNTEIINTYSDVIVEGGAISSEYDNLYKIN